MFRIYLTAILICVSTVTGDVTDPLHPKPHPTTSDSTRFFTDRTGEDLVLPVEEDAFVFAVFGDRTGGPAEGIKVLADAVEDVNLIEPDFVMTVGDLINGYNENPEWLGQMTEFKETMGELLMPWFPVAGNHDVYWRGSGVPPAGEHEREYEMYFGPLWYAFKHKGSMFIVLYTDEGDPQGRKAFGRPEAQRMSPEQFSWLQDMLERSKDAQHVFIFLHHPRWLKGGYGDDWDRVHEQLANAGNVRAVFAGHIHRMRYDGPYDNIEYITLATVGGGQSGAVPEAGYLHQFHLVTVRDDQIALSSLPVGEIMDVREITGTISDETARLASMEPVMNDPLTFSEKAEIADEFEVEIHNPVSRPIEVFLAPHSDDSRWVFRPEHVHKTLAPGTTSTFRFKAWRPGSSLDPAFRMPKLSLGFDYLAEGRRFPVPSTEYPLPMLVSFQDVTRADPNRVINFDGTDDALRVASSAIDLPDGPMTLEAWFQADAYDGRRGLVAKTEGSEYGFFVSDAHPSFYIHLDKAYTELGRADMTLEPGRWYHIAGVYDGNEARLYLDGERIAAQPVSGVRTRNSLPLLVGADVTAGGRGSSFFDGSIDEVRLSETARYSGASFVPDTRHASDEDTVLLLHMDASRGPWIPGDSPADVNATMVGTPQLEEDTLPGSNRD